MKNLSKFGLFFLAILLGGSMLVHADSVNRHNAAGKHLTGSITSIPSGPAQPQDLLPGVFEGEMGAELSSQIPRPDSPGTDTSDRDVNNSNSRSSRVAKKAWYLFASETLVRRLSIEVLLFPFHFFF